MKTKKRLLAILLTLSVLLSAIPAVAEETPKTTEEVAETIVPLASNEYDALSAMGFIGEDFAALSGDSAVSRAQFVGSLYKVAGFSTGEYNATNNKFIDVNENTLYKDEICYFYNAGYISGTTEKTFSPDLPITYQQAVKIIVDVLGYKDFALSRYGSGINAYIAMAQRLELTDGINAGNLTSSLNANNAVKLLFNAGCVAIFEPSAYERNGKIVYDNWKGDKLFERYNRLYFSEGYLQSNGVVSLLSSDVNEKVAIINGEEYLLPKTDLSSLIGCIVKFYYKDVNNTKTLVWAGLTTHNNILNLNSMDLEIDSPNYKLTNVVYKKNGKSVNAKVSKYADIIYNNAVYNDVTVEQIKPKMGALRLIDNNNDSVYDLVIVEEYKNVIVNSVFKFNGIYNDKYGNFICLDDFDNVKIYQDGKEVSFEEVKTGSIISAVEDINKKFLFLYVTNSQGQGVLKSFAKEDGVVSYEFEKDTYRLAYSYQNLNTSKYVKVTPKAGGTYRYRLDRDGNIADVEIIEDRGIQYAYVIKAMENDEPYAPEDSAVLRLLLQSGNFVTASTSKKLKIDGVSRKTGKDLLTDSRLIDGEGNVIEQVVRVSFDEDGDILEFEFAVDRTDRTVYPFGYDGEKFSLDEYFSNASHMELSSIDYIDKYFVDGETTAFVKYTNLDSDEPYGVLPGNKTGYGNKSFKLYDLQDNMTISVIQTTSNAVEWKEVPFLVDTINYLKEDGDFVKQLCGYFGGSYQKLLETQEGAIPEGTKHGDVLKIAIFDSRVLKAQKVISLADRPEPKIEGNYRSSPCYIFSYIYAKNQKGISMLAPDTYTAYGKVLPIGVDTGSKYPVTIYDVKNDTFENGDITDVVPSGTIEKDGTLAIDDSSYMAFITQWGYESVDMILVRY